MLYLRLTCFLREGQRFSRLSGPGLSTWTQTDVGQAMISTCSDRCCYPQLDRQRCQHCLIPDQARVLTFLTSPKKIILIYIQRNFLKKILEYVPNVYSIFITLSHGGSIIQTFYRQLKLSLFNLNISFTIQVQFYFFYHATNTFGGKKYYTYEIVTFTVEFCNYVL